jgi:hypothetical protein
MREQAAEIKRLEIEIEQLRQELKSRGSQNT